jgi:hypothetical protein
LGYHWLAITGATVGILGTAALSIDLLRTKTAEETLAPFKHLQDQIELASQELIVRVGGGLSSFSYLVAMYLSGIELDDEIATKIRHGEPLTDEEKEVEELSHRTRTKAVAELVEAQKNLPSKADIEHALTLINKGRLELEQKFVEQVALSQKLRRLAIWGVILVGLGAVLQLADLLLFTTP